MFPLKFKLSHIQNTVKQCFVKLTRVECHRSIFKVHAVQVQIGTYISYDTTNDDKGALNESMEVLPGIIPTGVRCSCNDTLTSCR